MRFPEKAGRSKLENLDEFCGDYLGYDDTDYPGDFTHEPIYSLYTRNFEDPSADELIDLSSALEECVLLVDDLDKHRDPVSDSLAYFADTARAWFPVVQQLTEGSLDDEYDAEQDRLEEATSNYWPDL